MPARIFFPPLEDPFAVAVASFHCERCPVQAECLEHALEHHELGVWAGTTADDRRRLRRERGAETGPLSGRVRLEANVGG